MKVLAFFLLVTVVSARPGARDSSDDESKEGKSLELTASLPYSTKRIAKQREFYLDGAEIPVHLVYEEGDETEAIVKEVIDSKDPKLNRVAREHSGRKVHHSRRETRAIKADLSGKVLKKKTKKNKRAINHAHMEPMMHTGPHIVKLKVRRGGVAIAGPGGVATAGSGGTAIVGPGGTAYTTADGTAVVGPGGRLIHLSNPYITKGRSNARVIATGPIVYFPMQL